MLVTGIRQRRWVDVWFRNVRKQQWNLSLWQEEISWGQKCPYVNEKMTTKEEWEETREIGEGRGVALLVTIQGTDCGIWEVWLILVVYQETLQMLVTTSVTWANVTTFYANNHTPPDFSLGGFFKLHSHSQNWSACGKGGAHHLPPHNLSSPQQFYFTHKVTHAIDTLVIGNGFAETSHADRLH